MSNLPSTVGKKCVNKPENLPSTTPIKKIKTIDLYPSLSIKNEVVFSHNTLTYQFSLARDDQLAWSKANKLWEIVGDSTIAYNLRSISDTDVYPTPTCYSCSHLQLIMYRLLIEEFSAIARATMPFFFATSPKTIKMFWSRYERWHGIKPKGI